MIKPIAILVTASLALGLAAGTSAASKSRHHRHAHHKNIVRRTFMSHSSGQPRHGRGVYGGVFSEPTVTNNGQAAPRTH